jgi:hypothetical protein
MRIVRDDCNERQMRVDRMIDECRCSSNVRGVETLRCSVTNSRADVQALSEGSTAAFKRQTKRRTRPARKRSRLDACPLRT